MQSFTFGSDAGLSALAEAMRADVTDDPEGTGIRSRYLHTKPYPMELNFEDFCAVILALREYGMGERVDGDDTHRDNAESLLSSIAETLGIDFV